MTLITFNIGYGGDGLVGGIYKKIIVTYEKIK